MDVAGQRVVVMGLGRFGGGLGVTQYLARRGARVLVTDLSPAEKLADGLKAIEPLVREGRVETRLGEHREADFAGADWVVANPAVPRPWENPYLLAARGSGVPITTEIGLTIEAIGRRFGAKGRAGVPRTIGVTGSVGKSTTTALIAHILRHAGRRVLLGGNLGGSLLEEIERVEPGEEPWFVLELSSFMLHWLEQTVEPKWSPGIAVVTNIAPNHLDWHGDMDHYVASKQHLIRHQEAGSRAILGASVAEWAAATRAEVALTGEQAWRGKMTLPGRHNRVNAFQAVAAAAGVVPAVPLSVVSEAVGSFAGLPHRLELVLDRGGVRAFNDSKSTTPEATLTAVAAMADEQGDPATADLSRVHLIAGGYDKGSDLTPIAELAGRLGGLYTIGQTGPKLAEAARKAAGSRASVEECGTLEAAVGRIAERIAAGGGGAGGGVVLLSPGCASWGQFTHYEARGEAFKALARAAWGA